MTCPHQASFAKFIDQSLFNIKVIANDLDVQRCNLLIHQIKRACTANLIVTNHEAQHFPGCHLSKNYNTMEPGEHIAQLLFDRVLCDVPCSGDGTLRKAPDVWRRWQFFFLPSPFIFSFYHFLFGHHILLFAKTILSWVQEHGDRKRTS